MSPIRPQKLRRLALLCAGLAALLGGLTLVGWVSGLPVLASVRKQYIPMAPSTALCFALIGMGLAAVIYWPGRRWRGMIPAAIVLAVALAKLLEYAFGWRFGIDAWLVRNPASFGPVLTGRMSPITASNFVFTALAVINLAVPRLHRLAGSCGAVNAIVALIVMVGYWYGTPLLYGGSVIPVALPTASAFLVCGVGIIAAAGLNSWPLQAFVGDSTHATLLRHFLPAVVAATLFIDWLRGLLLTRWPANPAALSAVSALGATLLITWIISRVAQKVGGRIDLAEKARNEAQSELLALNDKLEQRVLDRTRELREKNDLMEEELQMARELQFSLLPRQFPNIPPNALPQDGALQFLSLYFPTGNVSGDFFTVVQVGEKSVGIFICDVMGHGVRSALVTTMIRALVEENARDTNEPGELLSRVNEGLVGILKQSGTTMFATGFYLIVDVEASQLSYASAGHPAPLHIGHAEASVQRLNGKGSMGPAMGLFPAAKYGAVKRPLSEGDTVILFTDGLFEVESESGDIFTEQQLLDAIQRRVALPPQDMLDKVVAEVREFSHGKRFDDDVCVVGVQIRHTG